ncbi:Cobalt-precorrin-6 synthase [Prochlorococcus marinus str. SS2]|nr:Cobalt-precorrin-6 synthase [Prochlorococcus marinus str. SS2]KGG22667.1 Cobalt-precorrin-6 synthase [Prochlorococcus marinus str. SS35]
MVAAAKAAVKVLIGESWQSHEVIELLNNEESIVVPIRSASILDNGEKALGITNCDPGECLDLTRGLEIWVCLRYIENQQIISSDGLELEPWLKIIPGYGVGKFDLTNDISISEFARQLLIVNLKPYRKEGYSLNLEIIFPSGQELAEKTSNHAFGVVDGLALIGTQADVQESASPKKLQSTIHALRSRCAESSFTGSLIFVIGENGLDLALQYGIDSSKIIKTGNWLGPLLVAAAQEKVQQLLIFGYHGKLIKLAGGVFHTHHHLADNRLETLIAFAVKERIPLSLIKEFEEAVSIEAALSILENKDISTAKKLWKRLAVEIEKRSIDYVKRYETSSIEIGAVMFDRARKIRWAGNYALKQINSFGLKLEDY